MDTLRSPLPARVPHSLTSFTHVHGAKVFLGPAIANETSMGAWRRSIELYRQFRRGEKPGANRRPYTKTFSHSPWPEADSVRGSAALIARLRPSFPRTQFGLPLNLSSMLGQSGNFGNRMLDGVDGKRLASFVICKPMFHEGAWRPAIILLRQPEIGVADVTIDGSPLPPGSTLSMSEAPSELYDGSTNVWEPKLAVTPLTAFTYIEAYVGQVAKWQQVALP